MRSLAPVESPRFVSVLTQKTLAVVLAGGRGSRLGPLTGWRAKPAVPFGGHFRIIDFTLSNCINSGIRRVNVLTQYKAHSLIRHLHRGWGFLRGEFSEYIEVIPAQQRIGSDWYLGTADAVYQNLDIIESAAPEYVVVLAGDHIYKMDYGTMIAAHVQHEADVTVGCIEVPRAEAHRFGVMGIDADTRIRSFAEKPADPAALPDRPDTSLASMGIYVFDYRTLMRELVRDARDPDSSRDFGADLIPSLVDRARVFAFPFRDQASGAPIFWRDVGTVDAYWSANMELVSVTPELNIYDKDWPIWTYQQQVPPAKFVFDDDDRRGMAVDSMVGGGSIISGASVRRSLLFQNVHAHSGSEITDSVILPDVEIGSNCTIRRAVIDKACTIPPRTRIGCDPCADAQRYHVTEGGVTLVTPPMLGQHIHVAD